MKTLKPYFTEQSKREGIYCLLLQFFLILYIPLLGKSGNIAMALLLLFWLTEPSLPGKLKDAFKQKTILVLIAYYAIFIVGLLYTSNLKEGFSQLEKKSALLLFPVIMYTISLSHHSVMRLLKTFILVCALAGLAGLINGIRLFIQTGFTSYLYSDNLTLLMNGGQGIYFAVTVTLAIVFTVYLILEKHLGARERMVYTYLLLPFFATLVFLLAGRLSLSVLALLVLGGLLMAIIQRKQYTLGISILAVLLIAVLALAAFFPKTINRFKSLTYFHFDYEDEREVYHFDETEYEGRWSGLTIRLAIWSCTLDAAGENIIMGVGTGDHYDKLFAAYEAKNFKQGLIHRFGPHNQYLHTALSVGIIGLIVFLISLIVPAVQAWRERNFVYLVFLFVIAANMMIVDFLNVYRGVIFFAFLNSLLLFQPKRYPRNKA